MDQLVALVIRSASWREIASVPPPAGNGTIMRTARAGQIWAKAILGRAALTAAAPKQKLRRCIGTSLPFAETFEEIFYQGG
jgi:hypothetical protein